MDYIEFDQKKVYCYTSKFVAAKIKEAKEKFSKECKNNSRYSKEYIAHISDIDNIKVDFRQFLKYDIVCDMSNVSVDYSYDYTFTYQTGSHLEGEIKINTSTDTADASGLRIVKDLDSSEETRKGTTTFFSTEMKKCICHFGNCYFNDQYLDDYDEIAPNSSTNKQYKKLSEITLTKQEVTRTISLDHLPDHVRSALKEDALRFSYGDPRNFEMQISDYRIRECKLIIFPVYELDVYTEFDGEIYKCSKVTSINAITCQGPLSDHFERFNAGVQDAQARYAVYKWPTGKIYITTGIISILVAIGLIVLLAAAASFGNIGFAFMYKPQMIAIIVAMFAVAVLTGVLWYKKWVDLLSLKYSEKEFYDPRKPVDKLVAAVTASFRLQKKRSIRLSVVWLIIVLVISTTLSIISFSLYKKTDVENYWYTPEIVQKYEGQPKSALEELEILSCDDDGKIEAIYTSTYKGMVAKMRYSGQVTRKDYEETLVEFKFVEYIIKPEKGTAEKTMYIYFYHNDYNRTSGSLELEAVSE